MNCPPEYVQANTEVVAMYYLEDLPNQELNEVSATDSLPSEPQGSPGNAGVDVLPSQQVFLGNQPGVFKTLGDSTNWAAREADQLSL